MTTHEAMLSIAEAGGRIRSGRLSCRELVEQCLQQIAARDAQLRAWVRVDPAAARDEADRLDGLLAAGTDLGPLHGMPLGIKDIIDIAGWPTEAGSPLLAGSIAAEDAPVVARLRAAGAVLLGKTATTQFAFLDPAATRNPRNPEHTPGGSSSGSAAAVAAGMCLGAVGTQTGGSIIRPAAYCGIAGLKPTYGRVAVQGVVPLSRHLDHVGPLAGCVADLRILLGALVGERIVPGASEPPRLLVLGELFSSGADEAVGAATGAALVRLQAAGARFDSPPLPASFRNLHAMHRTIMAVEAAELHFAAFAEHADSYAPQITALIEEGLGTLAVDYALALRHQELFRQDCAAMLGPAGVAVTPATPTPAPVGLGSTGDPLFNSPWSYAGLPAATIPCGVAPGGLPCGLQLIAPAGREDLLLDAAQWCEKVLV